MSTLLPQNQEPSHSIGSGPTLGGRIIQATIGNLPELLRSGKPVAVDFWASWCAPCHVMAPVLRSLSKEFDGQVIFAKVDAQNNKDLAAQFNIKSIPTLVLFRNGKEWDRLTGVRGRSGLRKFVRKLALQDMRDNGSAEKGIV